MTETAADALPGSGRPAAHFISGRLHGALMAVLLLIVSWLTIPLASMQPFGVTQNSHGELSIQDFAGIFHFVSGVWSGQGGYDVESQVHVTRQWTSRPVSYAMFVGYSPTLAWLLAPFCLVPPALAYLVWTLLGFLAVVWMSGGVQSNCGKGAPSGAPAADSMWLTAVFFTPTAFHCFVLGQTALLSAAALVFLMVRSVGRQRQPPALWGGSDWLDGAVLWALTAKPPLALTAVVALLVEGRWQVVTIASGLSLVSTVAIVPWLGVGWVPQYLQLLARHNLEQTDPAFVWSLVPSSMGNLRALLSVTCGMGDAAASAWSHATWDFALILLSVAGRHRSISSSATWGLAVLAYLLFCPHVTSTEDLHLVLVLLVVFGVASSRSVVGRAAVIITLVILYLPAGFVPQSSLRIPAVLVGKLVLAGLVILGVSAHRLEPTPIGVTEAR